LPPEGERWVDGIGLLCGGNAGIEESLKDIKASTQDLILSACFWLNSLTCMQRQIIPVTGLSGKPSRLKI
jgi:hypothetical protein